MLPRDRPATGLHPIDNPKGILRMVELVGLLVFVALAIAAGMAVVPFVLPALGWLLVTVLTLTIAAGLLYVGGIALQLPMEWLGRTRVGRALASEQVRDTRRSLALVYWGILIFMAAGMLALEHFLGRQ